MVKVSFKSKNYKLDYKCYFSTFTEGRKRIKDSKVSGKKKHSEEEVKEGKNTGGSSTQGKSNKKQKVTQEKEGRKNQKVISLFHLILLTVLSIYIFIINCCKAFYEKNSKFEMTYFFQFFGRVLLILVYFIFMKFGSLYEEILAFFTFLVSFKISFYIIKSFIRR